MWATKRQDSVSTYEEVESLHSHQCSTFTSQEGSSCPSRLESFGGSSAGSLDHALPPQYANNPPAFSAYNSDAPLVDPRMFHPELQSPGSTDSSSRATSGISYPQSPGEYGTPTSVDIIKGEAEKEGKESDVNESVAQWVNQSYMESPSTEKDSKTGLSPKTEQGSHYRQSSRSDSIDRMDAEASPVTYRSMSPAQSIMRTASLDSSFHHLGAPGGFGVPWTPAENVLMTLGFGAMDLGIPERFMQSWRDNVIKKRIGELNNMLSGNQRNQRNSNVPQLSRQISEADSLEDFSINPKPKVSPPSPIQEQREQEQQASREGPEINVKTNTSDAKRTNVSPQPSEKQRQLEKLSMLRRRFKKAATVCSFGSHMLRQHSSHPGSANSSPCSTPELQKRQSLSNGKKYNMRPNDRGSAKDRRRKFINRQSSLPISLETLPEEDEGQKSKPQSLSDSFMAQRSTSIDVKKENTSMPPLKIVTEQASLEISEAKSYMAKQQSKDEAIADMNEAKKDMLNMEQYLKVIKTMIDSKDSGIGNDPSNEGSPQLSPRASATGNYCTGDSESVEHSDRSDMNNDTKMRETKQVVQKGVHEHPKDNQSIEKKESVPQWKNLKYDQGSVNPINKKDTFIEQQAKNTQKFSHREIRDLTRKDKHSSDGRSSAHPPWPPKRPSLIAMQEAFCQTVMEEDEEDLEDDVFVKGQGKKVDAWTVIDVNVAVQTSPSLMSPALSPLCAGSGFTLFSCENSQGNKKSKAKLDSERKSLTIVNPNNMLFEINQHGLSMDDDSSSTGTDNTQATDLSLFSNLDSTFIHQQGENILAHDHGAQIIDLEEEIQSRRDSRNMDRRGDTSHQVPKNRHRDTGFLARQESSHSGSLQDSRQDQANQNQDVALDSNGSSTSSDIVKSNMLHLKVDYIISDDGLDERGMDSVQTGSAYSTHSHDFVVPPMSHASSGIHQIIKAEHDFPDVPKIRASVVSSDIGRQYEALLKSALEKERARKHLTVAETLHLAMVKLESVVREKQLCRHTQLSDSSGSQGQCKFCDSRRKFSAAGGKLNVDLQKRQSIRQDGAGCLMRQLTLGSHSKTGHHVVERTRSAPNELVQRLHQDEVTRGAEARVNSVSSDFNDALMSVTGDHLLVDLDKVSKELPSNVTLSGITEADVKSIQAFHVLHENETPNSGKQDDKGGKDKKGSKDTQLQRRRSLFAMSSKSGSKLMLGRAGKIRSRSLSRQASMQSDDVDQCRSDVMSSHESDVFTGEAKKVESSDSHKELDIQQSVANKHRGPQLATNFSIESDIPPEVSKNVENQEQFKPGLSNENSLCYIVVNSCHTDNTNKEQEQEDIQQQNHSSGEKYLLKTDTHERPLNPLVVPPCSPCQKSSPIASQNSIPSSVSSPVSPYRDLCSASSAYTLLSPISPAPKTPPFTDTTRVGDSPINEPALTVSVSPTINLSVLPSPAEVTLEISATSVGSTIHQDLNPSKASVDQAKSKFRSEVFLHLPKQSDSVSQVDSSETTVSSHSFVEIPKSSFRLENIPSFEELCDKAEIILTNLKDMKEPSSCGEKRTQVMQLSVSPSQEDVDEELRDMSEDNRLKREGPGSRGDVHGRQSGLIAEPSPATEHAPPPHPPHLGVGYRDPRGQENHPATIMQMREREHSLKASLQAMEASVSDTKKRKQEAIEELCRLQEAVQRNRVDIQQAEEVTRLSVEKGQTIRSELVVLEYQRDQAKRELRDLEEGIAARRSLHPTSNRDAEARLTGAGAVQLGMSTEEISAVIKERDELKAKDQERGQTVPIEDYQEVKGQLDQVQKDLGESQEARKAETDKLQAALDESKKKMEGLEESEVNLKKQLADLQQTMNTSEEEHQKLYQEKSKAFEELETKSSTETSDLRHRLQEALQRVTTLESALIDKDTVTTRMQERIRGQGQEVVELTSRVEGLEREKEEAARAAEMAREVALVELRGKLLKEKQDEMDQQKSSLEKAHHETLNRQQTQAAQRQTQLEKSNQEKEEELRELRGKLEQQEEVTRSLGDQMRQEAQEQIKKALEEQKVIWEAEMEKERQREALAKEDAVAIETKYLKDDLKREQQSRDSLKASLTNLKQEVEKLREENLAAGREKVEAVSRAREEARQEIQAQLDQIREQMSQEKMRETEKLHQKLQQQEEELTRLRSEVKDHRQTKQRDSVSQSSVDHMTRSMVMELNEECRKTSNLVGSTPRKVPLFSSKKTRSTGDGDSLKQSYSSPGQAQLMAAMSNLKATNDDLRNYIKSLRDDLEKQRRATARANREKENEVKKLVSSLGHEKAQVFDKERDVELDRLQRLVSTLQDSEQTLQRQLSSKDEELRQIQSNMAAWKDDTALKMARKFEDELNKEIEIRLEESHSGSSRSSQSERARHSGLGASTPSSLGSGDTSTTKLLRHLQDRVKQLRQENITLKQSTRHDNSLDHETSFSKNLQLEEKDQQLYRLDQKVKMLERQLWVAEERCRENAALLSQKTAENTRLEGALTQQTKELMKVERAYSKLSHSVSSSPVP